MSWYSLNETCSYSEAIAIQTSTRFCIILKIRTQEVTVEAATDTQQQIHSDCSGMRVHFAIYLVLQREALSAIQHTISSFSPTVRYPLTSVKQAPPVSCLMIQKCTLLNSQEFR